MMKIYEVIVDDGKDVYKSRAYAKSKKELREVYGGNGDFLRVKDVTADYPVSLDKLENDLKKAGWGNVEVGYVKAILERSV